MMTLANTCLRPLLVSLTLIALCSSSGSTASNDTLIDAAKREGEVVYYASMNLSEANAVIGEFERRYPFIKVKLQRTGSEKLLTRVLTEARAKKPPPSLAPPRQERSRDDWSDSRVYPQRRRVGCR